MRNILVTGFGPFGGEPVNPALEAIKLLDGRRLHLQAIYATHGHSDHISAAPHGITDDFCKLQSMVSLNLFVQSCAVGGFHHDIIGFLRKYGIP